jgi:hypothetical protein
MSRRGPGTPLDLPKGKDGRPILTRTDLEAYDPSPHRSGVYDRYYCPIHGGDHQLSFSVNRDTGKYRCHSCGATGTLREQWPDGGGTFKRTPAPSVEEIGRRELAAQRRTDAERAERLAAEIPADATRFLANLDAMGAALRDPECPGAVYLRGRGLDPLRAADLGVGYAAPGVWPGDRGRRVGRIVYPLGDPLTGRIVSAVGRLCADPSPSWSTEVREQFKDSKQRKLFGCPAGVWPAGSVAEARDQGHPLVLVEGPADALALTQLNGLTSPVLALVGTANVLPLASLRGVAGVVLALDDDDGGRKATRQARVDLALAGVRVEAAERGWLQGAKDAGELAQRHAAASDDDGDDVNTGLAYAAAGDALMRSGRPLVTSPWDGDKAEACITAMYRRLAEVAVGIPEPWPRMEPQWADAIDRACEGHDWDALVAAVKACETDYRAVLAALIQTPGEHLLGEMMTL